MRLLLIEFSVIMAALFPAAIVYYRANISAAAKIFFLFFIVLNLINFGGLRRAIERIKTHRMD